MMEWSSCDGLEEEGIQGQGFIWCGATCWCALCPGGLGHWCLGGLVEERRYLFLRDCRDALGGAFGGWNGVCDAPVFDWRDGDNVVPLLMKVFLFSLLVLLLVLRVVLVCFPLVVSCLLYARYVRVQPW